MAVSAILVMRNPLWILHPHSLCPMADDAVKKEGLSQETEGGILLLINHATDMRKESIL